jgi:hypothetical protein
MPPRDLDQGLRTELTQSQPTASASCRNPNESSYSRIVKSRSFCTFGCATSLWPRWLSAPILIVFRLYDIEP